MEGGDVFKHIILRIKKSDYNLSQISHAPAPACAGVKPLFLYINGKVAGFRVRPGMTQKNRKSILR